MIIFLFTSLVSTATAAATQEFRILGLTPLEFIIAASAFVVVLFLLVMIHELGHYLTARIIGVRVEEFGFGLPPRIWGKKIGPTIYSLNALPIGGFVRLAGEDAAESTIEERKKNYKGKHLKEFFWARTKLERAIILTAGVTMNFVLALIITTGLLMYGVEEPLPQVKIVEVLANSPAESAGILPNDAIRKVQVTTNGSTKTIETKLPNDLGTAARTYGGEALTLTVLRDGKEQTITVTPRKEFPEGEGPLGVRIDYDVQLMKYSIAQAPLKAVEVTLNRSKEMILFVVTLPSKLLGGQSVQNEVAGPVGIAQVIGLSALMGIVPLLNIMSMLSLSLAILNLLPVPALDGGRLLFVIIEAITGKPINQNFERRAHTAGMIGLLALILFVTFNDIIRIFF